MDALPWPATLLRISILVTAATLLAACNSDGASSSGTSTAATTPASPTPVAAPPPAAVSLQGTPAATITAGNNYSFQPVLAAGGGTITFKVTGQPKWAQFDSDTGTIDGIPSMSDVGTSAPISITASNGTTASTIGPFTIAVIAPAPVTGSAQLGWAAPTQNTDGTPLTNLAGYHIYYGTSASALSQTIDVASPSTTSYEISNLSAGTYYFSVVAYNTDGVDSSDSNVSEKTI